MRVGHRAGPGGAEQGLVRLLRRVEGALQAKGQGPSDVYGLHEGLVDFAAEPVPRVDPVGEQLQDRHGLVRPQPTQAAERLREEALHQRHPRARHGRRDQGAQCIRTATLGEQGIHEGQRTLRRGLVARPENAAGIARVAIEERDDVAPVALARERVHDAAEIPPPLALARAREGGPRGRHPRGRRGTRGGSSSGAASR